jgi:pilus assembly protein CpaE
MEESRIEMLRGIIVCPDEELGASLEHALVEIRLASVVRTTRYPSPLEVERLIREHRPQIVFLGLESPERCLNVALSMEEKAPDVPVAVVGRSWDPAMLLSMMRAGVREFVAPPFEEKSLREAVLRIMNLLGRQSSTGTSRLYSFLPSKPGVGASTVALNTCLALARVPEISVLLADFDLNCGMIGFMLKLNSQYSVIDAVEHAHELDEELWTRLISCAGKLDVLPAGMLNPGHRIDPTYLHPLMNFVRRSYDVVCVDLSGMMEKYSIDLLHESGRILLVTTPEVPALHLAAQKLGYLRSLDLASRVQVILNRMEKYSVLSKEEMERMLGAPVQMIIPNDYDRVHQALMAGQPVEPSSKLGKRFEELARMLLESPEVVTGRKRRFLEYFSVGTTGSTSIVEK